MTNKIFRLPRGEAEALSSKGRCQLLFPLPNEVYIETPSFRAQEKGYTRQLMDVKNEMLDVQMPTRLTREIVENGARLWLYMGDGTHCSEILFTPNNWVVGDEVECQGPLYQSEVTKVVVTDVQLVRNQIDHSWTWYVELTSANKSK